MELDLDKKSFQAYEAVRASGITNMFDLAIVKKLTGLDKATVLEIMKNYSELKMTYAE